MKTVFNQIAYNTFMQMIAVFMAFAFKSHSWTESNNLYLFWDWTEKKGNNTIEPVFLVFCTKTFYEYSKSDLMNVSKNNEKKNNANFRKPPISGRLCFRANSSDGKNQTTF